MAWFEVSVLASTTSVALPKLTMAPPLPGPSRVGAADTLATQTARAAPDPQGAHQAPQLDLPPRE
jgi:hypothetical protein